MPVSVRKTDITELKRLIVDSITGSLEKIGQMTVKEIKEIFDKEGPGWFPLAESTIKAKGHDKILIDTGLLKDSIKHRKEDDSVDIGVFIEERAGIAVVHEFGSIPRNIPPRPFLGPGIRNVENKAVDVIGEEMEVAIREAFRTSRPKQL